MAKDSRTGEGHECEYDGYGWITVRVKAVST
jgi:hypothetical protein